MQVGNPELLSQVFFDEGWLLSNRLDQHTVLEYFMRSPFYSDNASAQKIVFVIRSTGLEDRGLFIIESRAQASPSDSTLLSLYFCLQGRVYQCPDIHAVCEARVARAAFHIGRAMQFVHEASHDTPGPRQSSDAALIAAGTAAFMADLDRLLRL